MKATRAWCALGIIGLGLFGLHTGIEYSGWVLFVGLMVAL